MSDDVESQVAELREAALKDITVGILGPFRSRWDVSEKQMVDDRWAEFERAAALLRQIDAGSRKRAEDHPG